MYLLPLPLNTFGCPTTQSLLLMTIDGEKDMRYVNAYSTACPGGSKIEKKKNKFHMFKNERNMAQHQDTRCVMNLSRKLNEPQTNPIDF